MYCRSSMRFILSVLLIVCSFQGALAIEVSFSAENGGEDTSIDSSYDVGTGVSVGEESTASFDQVKIENTRSVSGTGDINAVQTYSGSGGYVGSATLSSQGVSGSLKGNACLTPQSLTASQDLYLSGKSVDTGMSLANEGDSASLGVAITSGMIASQQAIQTGSVFNDISATCTAPWAQIKQQTSFKGIKDSTTTVFDNPTSKASVFNLNANSNIVGTTGYITSSGNLKDGKKVTGSDGRSNGEVSTEVKNAESFKYRFTNPGNWIGLDLTVVNADSISAKAFVTSGLGDSVPVSVDITKNWLSGTKGSLYDYTNEISFKDLKATATQSFSSAEGDNILLNHVPDPVQNLLWAFGGGSYAKITNGKVQGYKNSESIERTGGVVSGTVSQGIDYATGHNIDVGTYAFDNVGKDSANVITKVKSGSISSYSDKSTAKKDETTAYAKISAKGTETEITSHAENKAPAQESWRPLILAGAAIPVTVYSGKADFVALRTNDNPFSNIIVTTKATTNDVDISSSGIEKTALILEPIKHELDAVNAGLLYFPPDYFDSIGSLLKNKGYAVTDYTDSAVSWEKVYKLDEYTISMINTHGLEAGSDGTWRNTEHAKGDSIGLTISKGATEEDRSKSWAELQLELTNPNNVNDMLILDGCGTFKQSSDGTYPGFDAVKGAHVFGGFEGNIAMYINPSFMNKFFERMCAGDTFNVANKAAKDSVLGLQSLSFGWHPGYENFKLQGGNTPFKPPIWTEV